MSRGTIRLAYRKIIDARTQGLWEKYVFDATYQEYLMQAQNFNPEKKYFTFAELKNLVPGSDRLHFLVSASVTDYLRQLNGKMPDIRNKLGKLFVPFSKYKFEIIDSDIRDKSKHRVAIELISDPLNWIDTIGDFLLVTLPGTVQDQADGFLTEMFAMQPFLSIHTLKQAGENDDTSI